MTVDEVTAIASSALFLVDRKSVVLGKSVG